MDDRDAFLESGATEPPRSPELIADVAASFTYASFQNAIPVIRSIAIHNATDESFEACTLALTSEPPFLRAKTWTVDRLAAGDRLPLADRRVMLDSAYLAGLNEAERGEITLRLAAGDRLLAEHRIPVRLLARDEWGGVADMAQLLPAFVMPNDPAVARVLRTAAERLAAHGHGSALDGYQSGDPQRAYLLAASIYSAVAAMGLHYAEPPASFESRGQKVRRPSTIAQDGLATCLDTSLLFGAALEAVGLHPLVLLFDGHAAAGVWLTKRTLSGAIEKDAMEIRKALASRELIVFETTGVTHRPPLTMEHAQRLAEHRLEEAQSAAFVAAIDIRRSRGGGITPLASHEPAPEGAADEAAVNVDLPLPAAPGFAGMPAEMVEAKPTTAAGRIDRWQKKLLDLTLRNRLLNFPDTKKTIPFLCTDISALEDRLAAGASIRLISLPEHNPLGERDPALYREISGHDLDRDFAAEALLRGELASPLDAPTLEARLVDLYRQVRSDFAEGGANTLFLAVGFLRWRKKPEDEKSYRAPLLLVPVKIERRSASSRFTLQFHEDEPRFNATLLQFLERDFDLALPQFGGELPRDENGVDVPRLLGLFRHAIRDVPGMEVVDEAALSTFSFAKFLMWKDLVERTSALRENRVVKHLIDTPELAFDPEGKAFADERDLDRAYAPQDVISLLPADSSQIAASLAAAEGRDFVIVGPPGTGKSQTIANMIANCLAVGKTVLFVAEKTAALDVVHRRLREHGLGDHCLELHSNKADRKNFLAQLKRSWESGGEADAAGWIAVNDKLRVRRDQLNAYVEALHRPRANGLAPYEALGIALRDRQAHAPTLSWPSLDAHDAAARTQLEELAAEIGLVFRAVDDRPVLHLVDHGDWSSAWQESLLAAAAALRGAAGDLGKAQGLFFVRIGLASREDASRDALGRLSVFAQTLLAGMDADHGIMFDRDFGQLRAALDSLAATIESYRAAESGLAARYAREAVPGIPVDDLDRQWQEAAASIWPKSWFGRRRVRNLLQAHALGGQADPKGDLPLLQRMQEAEAAVDDSLLAGKPVGFAGLDTDVKGVGRRLAQAAQLRAALLQIGQGPDEIRTIARAIVPFVRAPQMDDPVHQAAAGYAAAFAAFLKAGESFAQLAGRDLAEPEGDTFLADISATMDTLTASRHLLRDWSSWCRVRSAAQAQGLTVLVEDLQAGAIRPEETRAAFRLAYMRWWLPLAIDADPVLRDFRRFQHEHAIRDFRDIDAMVRAHAVSRVTGAIAHKLPAVQSVPRNSELGLLRHQMELQRPSRSIREMVRSLPGSFAKLAPCMLMSPLSIAQYLPPDQALFDVAIFDEASQITTWDAVGAIARARQTIIVGDPKQLPPTNFFGRNDEEEEVAEHERDLESILDEAKAAGIPIRDLRWHYRSRHESLIAFSNSHYYQNRLITFPSPTVEDRAVRLRPVSDGVYDRGKSRTNRIEARALVGEALARLRGWLKLPEADRPTLGVITFNSQQQALIQDLLDEARRAEPELEWFFADERIEPAIVKNLENVQGDERDVILFSITFAADAAGKRSMDFGALNREGGERRLNVAVTRARQELLVFSGFSADQIDTARTRATGLQHLKTFLDFAERGAIALPAQDAGSLGPLESPFEEAVAAELGRFGWQVVPQVGISGFRVDIGVKHPDRSGTYLAGVECDGATYHASATARDRDMVREQVLRGLGWEIVRVWSTDWWFDPVGTAERLHAALSILLETSRQKKAAQEAAEIAFRQALEAVARPLVADASMQEVAAAPPPVPDEERVAMAPEPAVEDAADDAAPAPELTAPPAEAAGAASSPSPEAPASAAPARRYRLADLSGHRIEPEQFHDLAYRTTLGAMVAAILEGEAPLREDILAQRIARAHGWQRTGPKIRERVALYLQEVDRTSESSGEFVWKRGTVVDFLDYRPPHDAEARRAIAEIPLAELAAIAVANRRILDAADPALELSRLLGVERLAAISRARLAEAIERARGHGAAA